MSYRYKIPSFKNSNVKNGNVNNRNVNKSLNNSNLFGDLFSNNNNNNNNKNNTLNSLNNKTKNITNKAKEVVSDFNYKHLLIIILIIFIILFIIIILNYILTDCPKKKDLGKYLLDFDFNPCLTPDEKEEQDYTKRVIEDEKEVFHIANQDYTYEQAKCKCKAYGGRLATKAEITRAYNKGAEWCTYGWSEGQSAYYPTQKCTWDKMQKGNPQHRFDCGMPGINGGFFANPKLKFGINCYGIKPKGEYVQEKPAVCEGDDFCKLDINYGAAHKIDTDEVSPFNKEKWSQFD